MQHHLTFLGRLARLSVARRLIRGRLEMGVASAAAPAFEQHHLLPVRGDVAEVFARFGVEGHRAAGHLDDAILAVAAGAAFGAAAAAGGGHHVTLELEVQQRPIVPVAAQIDVSAPSAVAAVGPSARDVLLAAEVGRPGAALARAAVDLDVVNEIRFSHLSVFDAVDGLSNAFENLLDSTDALDGDVLPFAYIIGSQWGRLGVIDVESGLDGLRIVV